MLTAWALMPLLYGSRALAQQGTAALNGQVQDPSGLAVAGAKVEALNTGTNATYSAEANESGLYNFPTLPAGTYQVTASKEGFRQVVRPAVELHVSDVITLNFSLVIGSVSQSVTVEGGVPLVETTASSLGGLVNDRSIADLPLNGRNYIDLSLLQPGVNQNTNMPAFGVGGYSGTVYSANGAPIESNNFLLDGAIISNMTGWGTGSMAGTTLGVDGIKEYKILTSAFDASYGTNMGSQMVMISKGGTNQFHGDVFEYFRNSDLNARNYFDGSQIPKLEKNNFGGSFGGPIQKDKTFFYAVYESLHEDLGFTALDQVPAVGCRGAAGAVIAQAACPQLGLAAGGSVKIVNSQIATMLSLFPNPTNTATNQFNFSPVTLIGVNYGQVRVDHNFSASNTFFGRYTVDASNTDGAQPNGSAITSGVAFPQFRGTASTGDHFVTLGETHVFSPTVSNVARFSFSRTNFQNSENDLTALLPASLNFSYIAGQPIGLLNVTGLSVVGPGNDAGPPNTPSSHVQNIFALSDDLYYERGKHQLRFGALISRYQEEASTPPSGVVGSVYYSSLATFLEGIMQKMNAMLPGSSVSRNYSFYTAGFYAQDDWRIKSRLTLNLGLRYEFYTDPSELHGEGYALRPTFGAATTFTQGPFIRDRSYLAFSPRVGFAWDFFGDGKTAVRGGAGIYYDIGDLGGVVVANSYGSYPANETVQQNPTNAVVTFPFPLPTGQSLLANGTIGLQAVSDAVNYNAYVPEEIQYNLSVQRQLPKNMALSVAYVGTRGTHLWNVLESNPVLPTSGTVSVKGVATPYYSTIVNGVQYWSDSITNCSQNVLPACRANPNFGSIGSASTNSESYYDSLQVVLNKRLGGGLESQAAYTYAHALDTTTELVAGTTCTSQGSSFVPVSSNPRQTDYGPSCFDVRHNFRLSLLYHFPKTQAGGFLGELANGWWVGNIVTLESGYPFSPLLSANRSNSGNDNSNQDRPNIGTATVAPGQNGNTTIDTFIPYNASTVITGNVNQWFNPLMFALQPMVPCPGDTALTCGTLGNASRGMLRGPNLGNWDFSLVKDTALRKLGEQGALQFRAEFFNILNHANFAVPSANTVFAGANTTLGPYTQAPTAGVGQITSTVTTSRQIQFALKVIF
jgi:hypothetical protein